MISMTRFFIGLVLLIVSEWAAASVAELQEVQISTEGDETQITVNLSRAAEYKIFSMSNPYRVIVDVEAAAITRQTPPLPKGIGFVKQLRSANKKGDSLRIVFDLDGPAEYRSRGLSANTGGGQRLVVILVPAALTGMADNDPAPPNIVQRVGKFSVFAVIAADGESALVQRIVEDELRSAIPSRRRFQFNVS